jgi:hypothetical protein
MNSKLNKLLTEAMLDVAILKELARKKLVPCHDTGWLRHSKQVSVGCAK